jgi:hypothetical protein
MSVKKTNSHNKPEERVLMPTEDHFNLGVGSTAIRIMPDCVFEFYLVSSRGAAILKAQISVRLGETQTGKSQHDNQ